MRSGRCAVMYPRSRRRALCKLALAAPEVVAICLPVRPAVAGEVPGQVPVVQAVGERHVPRFGTPPQPGMARRLGGGRGQERRQHVLALDRDREPVHHRIGHPDRRPGRGGQRQTVRGADQDLPGPGGRGQPDPGRGRVRAQLRHVLAGRLDVHGGHPHPGRVQQPGRRLRQDAGHQGVFAGPVQQPPQPLGNPQPQRNRPVTCVVGEHDEIPAGHDAALRHPVGTVHDADNRHGGPPADGKTAIRATLVSAPRPAAGYPPAARSTVACWGRRAGAGRAGRRPGPGPGSRW
jgi:hypothetical protein